MNQLHRLSISIPNWLRISNRFSETSKNAIVAYHSSLTKIIPSNISVLRNKDIGVEIVSPLQLADRRYKHSSLRGVVPLPKSYAKPWMKEFSIQLRQYNTSRPLLSIRVENEAMRCALQFINDFEKCGSKWEQGLSIARFVNDRQELFVKGLSTEQLREFRTSRPSLSGDSQAALRESQFLDEFVKAKNDRERAEAIVLFVADREELLKKLLDKLVDERNMERKKSSFDRRQLDEMVTKFREKLSKTNV